MKLYPLLLKVFWLAALSGFAASAFAQTVIDLSQQKAQTTILAEFPGARFGAAIATGDLDGDGRTDIAIGAPGFGTEPGMPRGAVYIFLGRSGLLARDSLRTEDADAKIFGQAGAGELGRTLLIANLNGDVYDDLVLAAPKFSLEERPGVGAVYVLWGSEILPKEWDLNSRAAACTFLGAEDGEELGISLASGNITGEFNANLVIGAWRGSFPGLIATGKVYILNDLDSLQAHVDLYSQPARQTMFGENNNDWIGFSLATGDFKGDDLDDIAIGAYKSNTHIGLDAGMSYVIEGDSTLQDTIRFEKELPVMIVSGPSRYDHLGFSVDFADLNGDNFMDLIMGARQANPVPGSISPGAVYVMFGGEQARGDIDLSSEPADLAIYGKVPAGLLGSSVAHGDINGDSLGDLLMSAPVANTTHAPAAGEVYVVFGRAAFPPVYNLASLAADWTVLGPDSAANLGSSLAAGDLNSDGFDELLLGATNANGRGAVYILPGSPTTGVQPAPAVASLPDVFTLHANTPNPFARTTAIRLTLHQPQAAVRIAIYDVRGRLVRNVYSGALAAGAHAVHWDGQTADHRMAASGIYWVVVQAGAQRQARKMLLMR